MSFEQSHTLARPTIRFERINVDKVIVNARQRSADAVHVERLKASFEMSNQLQAIIVTDDFVLIDGLHRLTAARELGWTQIDAGIAFGVSDEEDRAYLEAEANVARKPMTITERTALWERVIKPRIAEVTSARRAAGLKQNESGNFPERSDHSIPEGSTVVSLAQQYVQLSDKTLEKVNQMQGWVTDDSLPEPIRQSATEGLARVDKIGKVDAEFKRVESQIRSWNTPAAVQQTTAAEDLVSRVISTITLASQTLKKIDSATLSTALAADVTGSGDWRGVVASATWILEFVENTAADAGIRLGGQ